LNFFHRPNIRHFSWDSGHIRAVQQLGLVDASQIQWYPVVTCSPFLAMGEHADEVSSSVDVAFCGNIYLSTLYEHPYWKSPVHRALTEQIYRAKMSALQRSNWDLFLEAVDA